MKCPQCHEEYGPDETCSCHTPLKVPSQPGPLHVYSGSKEETAPALAPTGLSNPFWKLDV